MATWSDFARFTELAIRTQDIDPVYPVLAHVTDGLDPQEQLWLVLLYLAYYDLPSAMGAWLATQGEARPLPDWCLSLPKATERRAHRDLRQLKRHLDHILDSGAWEPEWWQEEPWWASELGHIRWLGLFTQTQKIHGNGRWAAYKFGDLAHYVLGWNTPAPVLGIAHSSGPRHGLNLLLSSPFRPREGNTPEVVAWYEAWGDRHLSQLRTKLGREITKDRLETALCDFHSLVEGRYYVGHDIDQMQDQIERYRGAHNNGEEVAERIYHARGATLQKRDLGEGSGWSGVSKALRSQYRDNRRIWTRHEWEES